MTATAAKTVITINNRAEGSGIRHRSDWVKFMGSNVSMSSFAQAFAPLASGPSSATRTWWARSSIAACNCSAATVMDEHPISRLYRDARVMRIYAGTNEIMKLLIARSL